jgi:DNA polymerase III alpha subunit
MRRAMGKSSPQRCLPHEGEIHNRRVERGLSKKTAKEIFDLMASFADYGFNAATVSPMHT